MDNKTAAWIPLDSIVIDYLEASEQSNHKYNKVWNLAFRGMDAMGISHFYELKTLKLPVNKVNQTVALPSDYLSYNRIGVLNEAGEIVSLKRNPKLSQSVASLPDRVEQNKDARLATPYNVTSPFFFNFWGNAFVAPMYGVPSGGVFLGTYTIAEREGLILFNGDFKYDYIMLEYKATPQLGADYHIPMVFREAMVAWLAWKDNELVAKGRKLATSNAERKTNFFNELRLAIAKYKPFDLEQAYLWNLESQRLAVKY